MGGFCSFVGTAVTLEQQGYTPKCGETDKGVDNTAHNGGLAAADPCNDVKSEKSDAAPVDTADDGQYQRNAIYNHAFTLPFLLSVCRMMIII